MAEQEGFTLWFTGLSGAGKTALAKALEPVLRERGLKVERLDGDIVRQSLTRDLGFSKEDRDLNIERVTFVAKLLTRNGVAVMCSFISPYIARREKSRAEIGNFVECYIECPLEVLVERDVKGLYKKALAGEIKNFTGVSDPYEAPPNPEIVVNSGTQTIEESMAIILQRLEELGYVPPKGSPVDGDGAYSDEEEQEVEERLRALGYI
jgi:adenylyl-sulfate kinase